MKTRFKQLFLIFCLVVMLSACVTLTCQKDYIMHISSDLPNTSVTINQSNTLKVPGKAIVTHSKENLNLKILQNDSIVNDAILKSRMSNAYWLGNFFWGLTGWLVDLTTEKRFTYGENVHIDTLGNVKPVSLLSAKYYDLYYQKYKQGSANLLLSIPEINSFHLHPKGETPKNLFGFIGLGLGAEYFYKNNKSLQLRGDVIMDYLLPAPLGAVDWDESYPWESCYAFNVSLTDNFHINRFQLGYGFNFAKNAWVAHGYYGKPSEESREDEEPVWINGRILTNNIFGFNINTYYRVTNHFYMGIIYRPSFFELSKKPKGTYEYAISLDLLWKIGK